MPLNYDAICNRVFDPEIKRYRAKDVVRIAEGFGAGLPGPLQKGDSPFLDLHRPIVLPMSAVALGDGEFWQQDQATGLDWKKIVHASESIKVHKPLHYEGDLLIKRRVVGVYDRGIKRGAVIDERQEICGLNGELFVTVDAQTVALADGGFGGVEPPRRKKISIPDREPDSAVEVLAPVGDRSIFSLKVALDIDNNRVRGEKQPEMLRGVGAFGLAGRAGLSEFCNNDPRRLRELAVKYAGPLYAGETLRVEFWRVSKSCAVFQAFAKERSELVLSSSYIEFSA